MSDTPQVYAAISKVQGELARLGIGKGQTNTFDKYRFRGIDDVYNALAPLLADAGLVIIPQMRTCTSVDRASKNGGNMVHTTVCVDYQIAAADGSIVTATAFGEGLDRSDKSIAKASGSCWKYLMFQLFCIPVEGTPDSDSESHEAAPAVITAKQANQVAAAIASLGMDLPAILGYYKIKTLDDMTPVQLEHIGKQITKNKSEAAA